MTVAGTGTHVHVGDDPGNMVRCRRVGLVDCRSGLDHGRQRRWCVRRQRPLACLVRGGSDRIWAHRLGGGGRVCRTLTPSLHTGAKVLDRLLGRGCASQPLVRCRRHHSCSPDAGLGCLPPRGVDRCQAARLWCLEGALHRHVGRGGSANHTRCLLLRTIGAGHRRLPQAHPGSSTCASRRLQSLRKILDKLGLRAGNHNWLIHNPNHLCRTMDRECGRGWPKVRLLLGNCIVAGGQPHRLGLRLGGNPG